MGNSPSLLWISHDRGETWDTVQFLPQGYDVPIVLIGEKGYMASIVGKYTDQYGWYGEVPYFIESTDGGFTWSDPLNLWEAAGWTPYDSASCMWTGYNFVLDENSKPHIALKVQRNYNEYGDCWYLSPSSGNPGNWSDWNMELISGTGDGGQMFTQPFISYEPVTHTLVYIYQGFFPWGDDTYPDIMVKYSNDGGDTWIERGLMGADPQYETSCELPLTLSSDGSQVFLHMVFNDGDNPSLVYHAGPFSVNVHETFHTGLYSLQIVCPSIVDRSLTLQIEGKSKDIVEILIYDVLGRSLVSKKLNIEIQSFPIRIPTVNFPQGTYFIRVRGKGGQETKRFLVVH